jgi:large subunit ribosomal protein L3
MGKQIKGILGTKLGMTQVFNDAGQIVPVTVVQAGPCVVTGVRTPDHDGYSAVQLGFGEIDPRKVTKPVSGLFEKAGLTAGTSPSCGPTTRRSTRSGRRSPPRCSPAGSTST